jgi:hypothetical protein
MTNENQAVDHTREELKQKIHDYFVLGLLPRHKDELLAIADKMERAALAASKATAALSEPGARPPTLLTRRTTTVTDLSPAAQSVLDAANLVFSQAGTTAQGIAAVLRAAADQVVPCGPKPSANSDFHLMNWTKSLDQYYQRQQTRAELLAIADELEALPND